MTLRTRITLLVAAAVALAVAVVSAAAFVTARREVRGEIDAFLRERAALNLPGRPERRPPEPPSVRRGGGFIGADAVGQLVAPDGSVALAFDDDVRLPVDEKDARIAARGGEPRFHDVVAGSERYRVLTVPLREGGALQLGRNLDEADAVLADLGRQVLVLGGGGVLLAALVGWLVASRALAPVARLTDAAEHVAATQELTPIDVERDDELGRLAASFNAMLAALDRSRAQQRRLVLDAGHELRTPLTSLRTNIEVLARRADMAPDERAQLLADVTAELGELGDLVTELVDLATDSRDAEPEVTGLRFDEVAATAVARARRRTGREIVLDAVPCRLDGRPAMLERAVANLLDNAVKWSPEGNPIEVSVAAGRVAVRDHGPGIDDDDLPHVFDRFYRAPSARTMPGSGLGLAIVRHAAEAHGGRAFAERAPGGGAVVGFEVPAAAAPGG